MHAVSRERTVRGNAHGLRVMPSAGISADLEPKPRYGRLPDNLPNMPHDGAVGGCKV